MRRTAFLVLLLALSGASAGEPAPAPAGFFTAEEIARIDEALALVNMTRADAGFDKLVIDDPWRLTLVNRTLREPLFAADLAWEWAGRAGGEPASILSAAAAALDLAVPWVQGGRAAEQVREAFSGLTTEERDRLAAWGYAELVNSEAHDGFFPKPEPVADPRPLLALAAKVERGKILAAAAGLLGDLPGLAARTTSEGDWLVVAGPGDDVHDLREKAPAVLVDLGGNDRYIAPARATPDRPVAVVIDLSGDDTYGNGESLSAAAACFGVAILVDRGGGNDRYFGGNLSQGAALFGAAVLLDDGGSDLYEARDTAQGAGAFGAGVLLDLGPGNDRFHADLYGQGFAYTGGFGLLRNEKGNDVYDAGGVHLHYPLYNDRFQSLSQGFSIGIRPHASGGIALLVDDEGNDRYSADIYGQGASYWFSYGGLVDRSGNDTYVLGHYGQGAGIHLSTGCLLDLAGQDLYYDFSGVGIGGAHDFAVGILVDRAGDDYYAGSGGSIGGALTNSFALLLDAAGDDGYSAVRIGATEGGASSARGMGSIGLFLDLGGKDLHGSRHLEGAAWVKETYGAGIDLPDPPPAPGPPPAAKRLTPEEIDARVRNEAWDEAAGRYDPERLWSLCIQWPVGEMSEIVPAARDRFAALGDVAGARALAAVDSYDGLELLAVQDMAKRFRDRFVPALRGLLSDPDDRKRSRAAGLLADLEAKETAAEILPLLSDGKTVRAALDALMRLAAREHQAAVAALLASPEERTRVAAVRCLEGMRAPEAVPALAARLAAGELFTVRYAAEDVLVSFGEAARPALEALALPGGDLAARRHALRALARIGAPASLYLLRDALSDADWRVRFEAAGALAEYAAKEPVGGLVARWALRERLSTEENAFVRSRIDAALR